MDSYEGFVTILRARKRRPQSHSWRNTGKTLQNCPTLHRPIQATVSSCHARMPILAYSVVFCPVVLCSVMLCPVVLCPVLFWPLRLKRETDETPAENRRLPY